MPRGDPSESQVVFIEEEKEKVVVSKGNDVDIDIDIDWVGKIPLYRSIYWVEKAAKRGFCRAQYRLSWLLISRSYDLYDYLQVPKCSPMPLVLFWIRQAISDGGGKSGKIIMIYSMLLKKKAALCVTIRSK